MKQVHFIHVCLLEGTVLEHCTLLVNKDQPIVEQVLKQVITGDDKDFIINDLLGQFKQIQNQFVFRTEETLYTIF